MRNKILIIVTVIIVILAVVILIWKNSNDETETSMANSNETTNTSSSEVLNNTSNKTLVNNSTDSSETSSKTIEGELDSSEDIIINSEDLDTSNATFIKYEYDSVSIELIAINDENGNVKVSFNTCSVCNGSPKAYFTQQNGKLVCQNCKNKFSMSSIGEEGDGCYPICLDDSYVTVTDTGIAISSSYLQSNVNLFENVTEH